ncbi:MAG: sugar phosphate isomerase/epimerase family protein [Oscillospiraceae bacterium]|nr:sugar phosphate isomerase/epimerase family protein [Oscillospiraceae bacterium]
MKYGCCLNMVAAGPDGTGYEHLRALRDCGFDYAELPLAEMMAMSEADFAALHMALRQTGIPCEVCNNFFPKTARLTGPNEDWAALRYAEAALGRASLLGAKVVVFGSGAAKQVPAGFPLERGYEQVVRLLRGIGPMAAARGITIAIEPLRQAECNLINTFREGCRLADDVAHPAVRVLVDFYHMTAERESPDVLRTLGPGHLAHVHFANPNGRVYPAGAEEADYAPFFAALRAVPYDGRISCEAYAGRFADDAAAARQFFNLFVCNPSPFAEGSGKENPCFTTPR